MKLFLIAAVIAVSSAARLEHLERSYLPPDSNSVSGGFGSHGSNGFGSGHFNAGARGSQGGFNGGNSGSGVDTGFSGSLNGFGSSDNGVVDGLKQYLPPRQSASTNFGGPAGKPACSSCGFARGQQSFGAQPSTQYGQPQFAAQPSNQYGQPQFAAQPSNQYGKPQFAAQPSNQYGQPQFGAQPNHHSQPIGASPQFGFSNSQNQFGANSQYNQPQSALSKSGPNGFGSHFGQDSAASRQYLAPKTQEIPQQPFDEQTGYQY